MFRTSCSEHVPNMFRTSRIAISTQKSPYGIPLRPQIWEIRHYHKLFTLLVFEKSNSQNRHIYHFHAPTIPDTDNPWESGSVFRTCSEHLVRNNVRSQLSTIAFDQLHHHASVCLSVLLSRFVSFICARPYTARLYPYKQAKDIPLVGSEMFGTCSEHAPKLSWIIGVWIFGRMEIVDMTILRIRFFETRSVNNFWKCRISHIWGLWGIP